MLLVSAIALSLLLLFLGTITTRTSVDQTLRDEYLLRVSAVDGGGHAGYSVVRVHMMAQHSAMPTFLMTEYKANVFASVPPGTSVVKVYYAAGIFDMLM